jgi:hypothetical protein
MYVPGQFHVQLQLSSPRVVAVTATTYHRLLRLPIPSATLPLP